MVQHQDTADGWKLRMEEKAEMDKIQLGVKKKVRGPHLSRFTYPENEARQFEDEEEGERWIETKRYCILMTESSTHLDYVIWRCPKDEV